MAGARTVAAAIVEIRPQTVLDDARDHACIFYVLRGGCPWRMLPEHFPPRQTIHCWFTRFRDDGTWARLDHHLVMQVRQRVGFGAGPVAAVVDTRSVETTGSCSPRGYDAGKKINSLKRHALADSDRRSLELQMHTASVQHHDGAPTASMPGSGSPMRHPL